MTRLSVSIFCATHVVFDVARARDQQCADGQCDAQNSTSMMQKLGLQEKHIEGHANHVKSGRTRTDRCALDVAIVVDASGSICDFKKPSDFPNGICPYWESFQQGVRRFVERIGELEGSRKGANIGVVTYAVSTTWRTNPRLNTKYDEIAQSVTDLDWFTIEERETRTWDGMDAAEAELKNSGKRKQQRLTIVLTDGEPYARDPCTSEVDGDGRPLCDKSHPHRFCSTANNAKECTTHAADRLKKESRVVLIGIGNNLQHNDMKALATNPSDYYKIEDFAGLTNQFIDGILDDVCCLKNTEATCQSFGNLCFQNSRGKTTCSPDTGTCWCAEPDECVYWRQTPLTSNGSWGVCRKSSEDVRGEQNIILWLGVLMKDIFQSYWTLFTGSSSR